MVVGTSSHVGKSLMVTALCRIFAEAGVKVAPFKSQNMSLNAAVTPTGLEIGRAQAVQAHAAGIDPSPLMNPVLLKPSGHHQSQVVLRGVGVGNMNAKDYFLGQKQQLWEAIVASYAELASQFELIVIEGAGSPVEMNLKRNDLANLRVAAMANANVILVADIDRGGVFASVVGTLQLMEPQERARVRGVLINRFRGDPQLFEDGKQWLEDYTGIPVLGVIPYIPNLAIAEEDSLAFTNLPDPTQRLQNTPLLRIGILHLPHLANFTDFDPLSQEPDVEVVWIKHPDEMEQLDAVIIPGSKSTLYDLSWLIEQRLDLALQHHRTNGGFVLGICGGFQMMGARLEDPDQVESSVTSMLGLGMFTMTTVMTHHKATRWVDAHATGVYAGLPIKGYEMHMGITRWLQAEGTPFAHLQSASQDVTPDGAMSADGRLIGTYLHHLFHNDEFRLRWINHLLAAKGMHELAGTRSYLQIEEEAIAHLANVVKANVNMQQLFAWAGMRHTEDE